MEAGARCGKGKKPINDWHIPKLELLQSVVPNIRANGAPIQWSADATEHAHVTEIKTPARSTNNQSYEGQICRHLDRDDKCRRFDLATSVREAGVEFCGSPQVTDTDSDSSIDGNEDEDSNELIITTSALLSKINPVSNLSGPSQFAADYFREVEYLLNCPNPNAPRPFRTFTSHHTAFHLNHDPVFKPMLVDEVALKFGLPDLRPSLADFLQRRIMENPAIYPVGGRRRASSQCSLPFETLQVWASVRIQSKAYHNRDEILPPQTVSAAPGSDSWPFGRYDSVLVNTDCNMEWPWSGLTGDHCIAL